MGRFSSLRTGMATGKDSEAFDQFIAVRGNRRGQPEA